ncbi:PD-(D/E)XK nuclease family protein [Bacillus wiedmannii]|uniref:PD-(D/E)XK nuclease family protein n=1 Tax=Bacillus wiedmannii TaxID=1890302 RepID=UPI000BF142C5|nr:PD-(D/E)XK nuclease family protein [Bacillus wiedmannii]PEM08523.1 hypothetical protein CN610_19925 [Bacillus wiedmannii]
MSITRRVSRNRERGVELEKALVGQFNRLHSLSYFPQFDIESIMLKQMQFDVHRIKNRYPLPKGYAKFSPSSASKCKRELFYKTLRMPQDAVHLEPYQKRWARNGSAVHEAVQRDILYSEKLLINPAFKVLRVDDPEEKLRDGLPMWEKAAESHKLIEHNGVKFLLHGMLDGILEYKDGTKVGLEFKTKSTTIQTLEKMSAASASHKQQCVAYSILFGIDEFLITYESVAKDDWRAGKHAIPDIKPFYYKVTEKQREKLLDKFAEVAQMIENGEVPEMETSKCLFCPFKTLCLGGAA